MLSLACLVCGRPGAPRDQSPVARDVHSLTVGCVGLCQCVMARDVVGGGRGGHRPPISFSRFKKIFV